MPDAMSNGTGNVAFNGHFQSYKPGLNVPGQSREKFKGLPPGGIAHGSLMPQQKLRAMFIQLVQQGMSHKDAAKHIQETLGVHARTGKPLASKVEFTKEKKIKYAGQYVTTKHYSAAHRRPSRVPRTPSGLK